MESKINILKKKTKYFSVQHMVQFQVVGVVVVVYALSFSSDPTLGAPGGGSGGEIGDQK